MDQSNASLDTPLHGAEAIGRAAGTIRSQGKPTDSEMANTYYACKKLKKLGVVDKFGAVLVTTRGRLNAFFGGRAA
jgi:hypothetical protein